jgi:hypothetical protein
VLPNKAMHLTVLRAAGERRVGQQSKRGAWHRYASL